MGSYPQRHIHLFYVVTALFWASLYAYQPTMSPYLDSIGISYTMIGMIGGSYGFTQMLLRIPLGLLSDRLGRRKLFMIWGIFVSVISSLLLYFTKDPLLILVGRALAGAAASAWVIFTVLFSSYFEKEKAASRISFLNMCNNSGQVAAMLLGSMAAGYLGYKFPFLLAAVLGAAAFIASFFIRENVPARTEPPTLRKLLAVAKDKNLLVMSLLAILAQFIMFGALTFTPLVATGLQATGEDLGYLALFSNVPRILSALLCGILLARKFNSNSLLTLSFILMGIGSLATPFCGNLPVLYVVCAFTGFGTGISMTLLLSLCTRSIDNARCSAAMGFFQASYGVGMFLGPVAVGGFADGFGIVWGFILSAVVAAFGAVGCLKLLK